MSDDEQLGVRLREAVAREAAGVHGGPGELADRLVRGTRQPRRRRTTGAAAALVVVLLVAGLGTAGLLLARQGDDALIGPDRASGEQAGPPLSVAEAGAVTAEMAAREGLDGTAQCLADGSTPAPEGSGIAPGLTLYAAFLTDRAGLDRWSQTYSGSYVISRAEPSDPAELFALCWYSGDVPRDLSAGGPGLPAPTHQLVAVRIGGPGGAEQDFRYSRPLPVLAPDPPAGLAPDDAVGRQGMRVFAQPEGVAIVEQMPRRTPPPQVEPVDCTPTACSDPNEEVVVAVELRVDGEPLDPSGVRELDAGKRVDVTLELQVEEGQTIRDVHLGYSATGSVGGGPDGPIGLDEVLLRQPAASGTAAFDVTWTVPAGARSSQLVLYYVDDKYQQGVGHSRTLGGVTARRS
jgi:hypothetical protein